MSDGKKLYGVQFDPAKGRSYPFWEQEFDYADVTGPDDPDRKTGEEARTQYDQSITDRGAAKGRQYDNATIVAAILAELYVKPVKVRVTSLPATLKAIAIAFNKSVGNGESHHPATQMDAEVINAGTGSISPRSTTQASASIQPIIMWDIDNWQADALVNGTLYEFSVQSPFTVANVISRLNASPLSLSVSDLPVFKKKAVQISLFGSQVSLQQSADTQASLTFNTVSTPNTQAYSFEYGDSFSKETGTSTHIETIPETIHGTISLSGRTDSQDCTTLVTANTPALVEGAGTVVAAITNEPTTITATASAEVSAQFGDVTSIPATSPAAIPTSGKYLVDVQPSDDEFGLIRVSAIVVDFAQYA